MPARLKHAGAIALLLALGGCGGSSTTVIDPSRQSSDSSVNGRQAWQWRLPPLMPTPRVPDDNPMTVAKVELGRFLFYDPRLSGNATQSCGSCHEQAKAFTDGKSHAVGSTGDLHPRNTQSLVNVVYSPTLTWANPALTRLEQQLLVPLFGSHPVELGVNDQNKAVILQRLAGDGRYPPLFADAFPNDSAPISLQHIAQAIAAFERSVVSADSPYDRYLRGEGALSAPQQRGMALFFGEKAECFHCHGSFNLNDQTVHAASQQVDTPFHNTGLYNVDAEGSYPQPNNGLAEFSLSVSDRGKFRAPSLRNVALTAPYNHDGSVATLDEVVGNYARGGRVITQGAYAGDGRFNPNKDPLIVKIDLTQAEQKDLVAFLEALTDQSVLANPAFSSPFDNLQSAKSALE